MGRVAELGSLGQRIMPAWLQILGAVLGAIGSILGGVNIWLQWRDKKERINISCVCSTQKCFRLFNPTARPIEIHGIDLVTGSSTAALQTAMTILQPFTSHDITLATPQCLDLAKAHEGSLKVKTGSGATYAKTIRA